MSVKFYPLDENNVFSDVGYEIFDRDGRFNWRWVEPGEPDELGEGYDTLSQAYAAAAADWEQNGSKFVWPNYLGKLHRLVALHRTEEDK